jgi:F0F1-type ATP synthase assembly protein I
LHATLAEFAERDVYRFFMSAEPSQPDFSVATINVLKWQVGATLACTGAIWALSKTEHAGLSALIGGGIICVSFAVFGWLSMIGIAAARQKNSTGMWAILRAEIIKLALILGLTVWVMRRYTDVVLPAMFGTFLLVMLVGRFVMLKNAQKY